MELRCLWNNPGNGQSHLKGKEQFAKCSQVSCLEGAWDLHLASLSLEYQHSWLP